MTDRIAEDQWVIVKDCVQTPPAFHAKDWAYIAKSRNRLPKIALNCTRFKIFGTFAGTI